jgi:hypothetical protein
MPHSFDPAARMKLAWQVRSAGHGRVCQRLTGAVDDQTASLPFWSHEATPLRPANLVGGWCSFAQDRPELVLKCGKRGQQRGGTEQARGFDTACNVVSRIIRKVCLVCFPIQHCAAPPNARLAMHPLSPSHTQRTVNAVTARLPCGGRQSHRREASGCRRRFRGGAESHSIWVKARAPDTKRAACASGFSEES